jgi:hypothetical protein
VGGVIAGFVKAGKVRGCGSRDLNKSRGNWISRV